MKKLAVFVCCTILQFPVLLTAKQNVIILFKQAPIPQRYQIHDNESSTDKYQKTRAWVDHVQQNILAPYVKKVRSIRGTNAISEITYLPFITAIAAKVSSKELANMQRDPNIEKVISNGPIFLDKPVAERTLRPPQTESNLNEALILHKVDQLIAEGIDINKPGKLLGVVDTGVDGKHPELAGKIIRFMNMADGSAVPVDTSDHGTHVSGIIAGGNVAGLQLGVYPGAKLIATAALSSIANFLKGWQWILDPDGNPQTNDYPFAINNSWHIGNADPAPFYRAIETFKRADILICFSAGNTGSSGITHPKEHPLTFTSAAVDKNGVIGSFSSWGPALWLDQKINKPEIATMGVAVYSTLPGGGYGRKTGTSMASPFTTGAIGLLGAYFPKLSPYKIAEVLLNTTQEAPFPLRKEWHKKYGQGLMNVYAAFQVLKKTSSTSRISRISRQNNHGRYQNDRSNSRQ